jgi:hypothetical protein
MKPVHKDELYEHLNQFFKAKGIELKDGSYPRSIQAGCSLLADAINLSQKGFTRAKSEIDKNFDLMRQVIHEKTAPKAAAPKAGKAGAARAAKSKAKQSKRPAAKR